MIKKISIITLIFAIIISVIAFFSHYTIINGQIYSYEITKLDISKKKASIIQESKLKKFKKLKVLNIRTFKIHNLSFLNDMDDLEELQFGYISLSSSEKIDGSALHNVSDLKCLRIVDINRLTNWDTNEIENFKNLTFLEISFSYLSSDAIDDISRSKSLEKLDLAVSTIVDLSALKELDSLKTLDLFRAYLKNPSGLYELDQIVNLVIVDVQKIDVNKLAKMRSLKRILISEGQMSEEELSVIKDASIKIYYDSKDFYSDVQ